ncbi:MAG: hypothetical protein HY581_05010 [Nitrospirae bacterium]|nr:hypothetical protein [Nitrospirota bacterium]
MREVKSKKAKVKSSPLATFTFYLLPFTFAMAGCAVWPWRVEPPLREATAEQLISLLQEREAAIQTMKGLFRAQIKGPGIPFAQRLEGAMYYRRPNALRLQGFTQLGGPLFELVLKEDVYRLRLAAEGQVYTGRVADLERKGKIGRPFQMSVLAMSGAVGIASVSKGETVRLSEDRDRYRLDVLAPGETGQSVPGRPVRRLWFERRSLQVVQEDRLSPTGEVEATVRFEDFRPVDMPPTSVAASDGTGTMVRPMLKPFKITTQDGQGNGTVVVTFHEMVPNPTLKPDELGVAQQNDERRMLNAEC